jgi:hypothetical protein
MYHALRIIAIDNVYSKWDSVVVNSNDENTIKNCEGLIREAFEEKYIFLNGDFYKFSAICFDFDVIVIVIVIVIFIYPVDQNTLI